MLTSIFLASRWRILEQTTSRSSVGKGSLHCDSTTEAGNSQSCRLLVRRPLGQDGTLEKDVEPLPWREISFSSRAPQTFLFWKVIG